jgi:SAM-dependent methyltransferase
MKNSRADEVTDRFRNWLAALEARHLADLTFQEVSRSLRALSSTYVERRGRLHEGAALSGAGKRAAFALFYGPLHYLLIERIVEESGAPFSDVSHVLDLGCGTGASAAGWAAACARPPRLVGIDRHPWAIDEARRTASDLDLQATFRVDDLTRVDLFRPTGGRGGQPRSAAGADRTAKRQARGADHVRLSRDASGTGVLLAFAVNEIADAAERDALLQRLLEFAAAGGRAIVVEPLAGFVAPWWAEWRRRIEAAGGRGRRSSRSSIAPPVSIIAS